MLGQRDELGGAQAGEHPAIVPPDDLLQEPQGRVHDREYEEDLAVELPSGQQV